VPEHFASVTAVNLAPDGRTAGATLFFRRAHDPPTSDANVEKLRSDYEATLTALKEISPADSEFTFLFNEILAGAQVGLQGPNYNLSDGRDELDRIRKKIVRLARESRDKYLISLAVRGAVVAFVPLAVLGAVLFATARAPETLISREALAEFTSWFTPLCLLHPGVALGVVAMGFILNRKLEFENIGSFDPNFSPNLRLTYVALLSYILFLTLWFSILVLGVGSYRLDDLPHHPANALLIGLLCGVSDAVVVDILLHRLPPVAKS